MNRIVATILTVLLLAPVAAAESLDEAWAVATAVNNRLRAQSHQVAAAQAELRAARAAKMPTLSNQTTYVALSERPTFSIGVPAIPPILPVATSIDVPLSDQAFGMSSTVVAVPLFTGGKIKAAINANRYQVNAAQAGLAVSFQDIKLDVAKAYLDVLRARQLKEVAGESEKSIFRHRHDVGKLLEQKIVTRNALLAAQTAWAAAAQRVLKADNLVLAAESAYNRYMGRPLDFPVLIDEISVPPTGGDLARLTDESFRCRKELTQVASQSQAAAALSRVSHADRLPQVVAMGGHLYMQNSSMDQESLFAGAVGLNWKPLDGGASRAREHAALQNAAAAARMRDEIRSLIALQVRTAWLTEQETRSRIEVARLGREQAEENLRVVTRQFQEGLVNHTEVLDAQTQNTAASVDLCNATYDAIHATFQLKRAVGLLY